MNTTNGRPKILLIVEDYMLLAVGLKYELEDNGYQVLELAIRHQEAIGYALQTKPDLALVNIHLAQGEDGASLASDLKAMGIPVMFISGQTGRARAAMSMAVASMPKPYTPGEIVSAVDYLFRHADGDESQPCPLRLEMFDRADGGAPAPDGLGR